VSEGWAPTPIQYLTRSSSSLSCLAVLFDRAYQPSCSWRRRCGGRAGREPGCGRKADWYGRALHANSNQRKPPKTTRTTSGQGRKCRRGEKICKWAKRQSANALKRVGFAPVDTAGSGVRSEPGSFAAAGPRCGPGGPGTAWNRRVGHARGRLRAGTELSRGARGRAGK